MLLHPADSQGQGGLHLWQLIWLSQLRLRVLVLKVGHNLVTVIHPATKASALHTPQECCEVLERDCYPSWFQ